MIKTLKKAVVLGILGGLHGYYLGPMLAKETAVELTQTLGYIAAVGGSFLLWIMMIWLGLNLNLVKRIIHDTAERLFYELSELQNELIRLWSTSLFCAIITVVFSAVMKTAELSLGLYQIILTISSVFLITSLGLVAYLFQRMAALENLKSKMDDYEYKELRKKRNLPN